MKNSTGCDDDPCTRHFKLKDKLVNGIVNGGDWRLTNNTFQDYSYIFTGSFDISFFISCERKPKPERLLKYWIENRFSLIDFIKQVHQGVKGLIFDERNNTMTTANAESDLLLSIEGIKNSTVASNGDYFRLLAPGQYNLSVYVGG